MVKYKKVLKMLGVALTLAMLLMAIPAAPAMALAYTVSVENTTVGSEYYDPPDVTGIAMGEPGDKIRVFGEGSSGQEIDIYFARENVAVTTKSIDTDVKTYEWLGGATINTLNEKFDAINLTVPTRLADGTVDEDVHGGVYYIYITTTTSKVIKAKTTFTVLGVAKITGPDPDSGPVGTEVEITGEGFAPDEDITIEYDGEDITDEIVDGDEVADEDGEFYIVIPIPESTSGEHTMTVIGEESLAEIEATFTVEPKITLNVTSGLVGTTVTINGTGFARRNGVIFSFGGEAITPVWLVETGGRTNSSGNFAVQIVVPQVNLGNYTIKAVDEDKSSISAQATFAVTVPPLEPTITIDPTSGNVGDEVEVTGAEFGNNKPITLYFDNSAITPITPITSGTSGSFTGTFEIPESISGDHTIKAEDNASHSATATLAVEPEITMAPTTGPAGTEVTVTGTGFGYRSDIETIEFDSTDVDIESGDSRSGTEGSFEFSFIVPAVGQGKYDLMIGDEDGNSAEAKFTVEASSVTISPTTGIRDTEVAVSGTGFVTGSTVSIKYYLVAGATTGEAEEFTATAGSSGAFSATFNVPASEGGNHTIIVSDGINSVSATFAVLADAAIAPTSGSVGEAVAISGIGFGASRAVTITYDGTVITPTLPITTGADGSLSGNFTVPASAGGDHTIAVSDGVNTKQFTFAMETTPPPAPVLALVYQGIRAEQPLRFDWSDVTDLSLPVKYNLQIYTVEGSSEIVKLNKTGLDNSEYTLTEAEELEKVSKDEPYYWRVNAVDSASNISGWSNVDSFYIGGGWPGWLMWLGIGLGALVIFIFAIWLGRRIAFSSY